MNALTMVNELLSRFGIPEVTSFGSTGSDSVIALRKINLALQKIYTTHPFKFLHKTSVGSISSVAGTSTYSLASDVKQLLIGKHAYQNGGWLHVVDRQTLETYVPKRSDTSQRNVPTHMILFGKTQSGSNWLWQVELWPVPDSNFGGQTISYYYTIVPSDLSATTDVPILPDGFHWLAIDMAEMLFRRGPLRIGGDQNQIDLYQAVSNDVEKGLAELIRQDSISGMDEATFEVDRGAIGEIVPA